MSNTKNVRAYSGKEEVLHALIHGIGIALSIAGLVILVCLSCLYGNVWSIVSSAIFGTTLVLMYTASTIYHSVCSDKKKKCFKKLDHIAIYYLIAGTYTPFLLVLMRGPLGWTLFGIVWALAVLGTILKLYSSANGTKVWSLGLYLAMGWLILCATHQVWVAVPKIGLIYLILGGLFYTLGILFYVWKSKAYTHAIWHLFVLLGSVMHFFAVLYSCVLLN